jgi:hypothetical protein
MTGGLPEFLAANRRNWDERVPIHRRDAGLTFASLNEHSTLPWPMFPMCVRGSDGMWRLPDHIPTFPLSVSLRARKREDHA